MFVGIESVLPCPTNFNSKSLIFPTVSCECSPQSPGYVNVKKNMFRTEQNLIHLNPYPTPEVNFTTVIGLYLIRIAVILYKCIRPIHFNITIVML